MVSVATSSMQQEVIADATSVQGAVKQAADSGQNHTHQWRCLGRSLKIAVEESAKTRRSTMDYTTSGKLEEK